MKKSLKVVVLGVAMSMMAGMAFADRLDISSVTPDLIEQDRSDAIIALFNSIDMTAPSDDNVAFINQFGGGDPAYAYIDQSGGNGNFAAVLQDTTNAPSTAIVYQEGNANLALVNQH